MRLEHPVLTSPLAVKNTRGGLVVLERIGKGQAEQGEAIELDTIAGSCDAEVVARGTSAKGPARGSIVRHGPFTLWGFAGGVREMTGPGRDLFINTLHYAARQGDQAVLERRMNKTRYGLEPYLASAGLLETVRQYLPEEQEKASKEEVEAWIAGNRPYLRSEGRRLVVDRFARAQGIPNHKLALLERAIECLGDEDLAAQALEVLERYTGQDLGPAAPAWRAWYEESADYLFFSDCDGFRFVLDEQAQARGIPFEELRGWSSEEIDYAVD